MKYFCGALALVLCASGADAAPKGYVCELRNTGGSRGGFVQSPIAVIVDGASAQVIDALIMAVVEQPVTARVRPGRGQSLRLSWNVNDVPTRGSGSANVRYSAIFDPSANKITVRGSLTNSVNDERGSGACRELSADQLRGQPWARK